MKSSQQRPRVLVFNQYYWPGVEATAHLLTELSEALAEHADVTVVTGTVDDARAPERLERNGVRIVRVHSPDSPKLTWRVPRTRPSAPRTSNWN